MLISFAVENHRSIRDRVELSFVAEGKPTVEGRAALLVPGFDMELVPVVALLGANGSGKSNVLAALAYVADAVRWSQAGWQPEEDPPRDPFHRAAAPSRYELSFVAAGAVYDYRFEVGDRIVHEALEYAPRGPRSWTKLFERHTNEAGLVAITAGRALKGPRAAAEAATRPNSLFLSSAAQNNHPLLTAVWTAIVSGLRGSLPSDRGAREAYTQQRYLSGDATYRRRLSQFIASADLGVEAVDVAVEQNDEPALPTSLFTLRIGGRERVSTTFVHRGGVGQLDLTQQSAGTRAWFEWSALVLDSLDSGVLLAADELDSHLNVALAAQIVALFQAAETNRHEAQLLFNLQDPGVVSDAGLGRDQVWITEKLEHGGTTLVPVTDYSLRRDHDVGRLYRHGRVGGLPVVDEPLLHAAVAED